MTKGSWTRRAGAWGLGLVAVALSACGGEANPTYEIDAGEEVADRRDLFWDIPTRDRLGVRMPGAVASTPSAPETETETQSASGNPTMDPSLVPPAVDPNAESPILWDMPAEWSPLAPTSMRLANFQAGNPAVECYVTILGGDGGGLLANVNRWRDQMGLAPIGSAELATRERVSVLGEEAVLVDLTSADDLGLIGTVSMHRGSAVFVKMIGPATLVGEQRAQFLALCSSLAFRN